MFIAFDGIDGAGKSTQVKLLCEFLSNSGKKVTKLDMGGCGKFKDIIQEINDKIILVPPKIRELVYYFEVLYCNLNYIQTASAEEFVIIDRYYLSYYAYGMENGMSEKDIDFFTKNLIEPDFYFFIDCSEMQSSQRISAYRDFDMPELGFEFLKSNVYEENYKRFLQFQNNIRKNFYSHIKPHHILLKSTDTIEALHERIKNEIF